MHGNDVYDGYDDGARATDCNVVAHRVACTAEHLQENTVLPCRLPEPMRQVTTIGNAQNAAKSDQTAKARHLNGTHLALRASLALTRTLHKSHR